MFTCLILIDNPEQASWQLPCNLLWALSLHPGLVFGVWCLAFGLGKFQSQSGFGCCASTPASSYVCLRDGGGAVHSITILLLLISQLHGGITPVCSLPAFYFIVGRALAHTPPNQGRVGAVGRRVGAALLEGACGSYSGSARSHAPSLTPATSCRIRILYLSIFFRFRFKATVGFVGFAFWHHQKAGLMNNNNWQPAFC